MLRISLALRDTFLLRLVTLVYRITEVNASKSIYKKGGAILDTLYTTKEIAKQYKVPLVTVQKWIREGKLTAYRLGKEYRVKESDLLAFVQAGKTTTA